MSFNIWVNGGRSLDQCVEAIRLSGADLVGLQECNAVTAQTIAANLGFHYLGVNDVSMVSRYPILRVMPTNGGSGVTIELSPGQRVHLFNCHLAAYPYGPYRMREGQGQAFVLGEEQQTRMPALRQLLDTMAGPLAAADPCFLTGDFNAPSHLDYADYPWPTSLACSDAGLADAYHVVHPMNRTYPPDFGLDDPGITWTPFIEEEPNNAFDRIDFLYFSGGDGVEAVECSELDGRNSVSPWPSDHRAVLGKFTLEAPVPSPKATIPSPVDGVRDVNLTPSLSWLPGTEVLSRRLYFGTNSPGVFVEEGTEAKFSPEELLPETTYYWRIDEVKTTGVVTGEVWSFTTAGINVYEWTFEGGDLTPVVGEGVLEFADGQATAELTQWGTSDGDIVPHLDGKPTRYLRVPAFAETANGYQLTLTRSHPNGGGRYLNQYTIIWDLLIPQSLGWIPLFNTNPQNANDADFYIDPSGRLGIGPIGYSPNGSVQSDRWHRIAFAANLEEGEVTYYVDGEPVFSGPADLDGRHSLYSEADTGPDLLLFNEGDTSGVYTHEVLLGGFFISDRALDSDEMRDLGGPKAHGITAPISSLELFGVLEGQMLQLTWAGGEGPFTVLKTDTMAIPDWRRVFGPTSSTNASIPLTGSVGFLQVAGQAP